MIHYHSKGTNLLWLFFYVILWNLADGWMLLFISIMYWWVYIYSLGLNEEEPEIYSKCEPNSQQIESIRILLEYISPTSVAEWASEKWNWNMEDSQRVVDEVNSSNAPR